MLVAVDIGNTNIVLGFLDGDTIAGTYRITTIGSMSRNLTMDERKECITFGTTEQMITSSTSDG